MEHLQQQNNQSIQQTKTPTPQKNRIQYEARTTKKKTMTYCRHCGEPIMFEWNIKDKKCPHCKKKYQ